MIPPLHHFASARFLSCLLLPLYFFLIALGSHFWRDSMDILLNGGVSVAWGVYNRRRCGRLVQE